MKVTFCITLVIISVAASAASPSGYTNGNTQTNQGLNTNRQSVQDTQQKSDLTRDRKSTAYGAITLPVGSIPAPLCPKNYLFSCQPHLVPVPCADHYHGHAHYHGHLGDYSAPVPTYMAPVENFNGLRHIQNGVMPQSCN